MPSARFVIIDRLRFLKWFTSFFQPFNPFTFKKRRKKIVHNRVEIYLKQKKKLETSIKFNFKQQPNEMKMKWISIAERIKLNCGDLLISNSSLKKTFDCFIKNRYSNCSNVRIQILNSKNGILSLSQSLESTPKERERKRGEFS